MSRRKSAVKRTILPDARYDSQTVSKFINVLMYQGKKSTAERIFYAAMTSAASFSDIDFSFRSREYVISQRIARAVRRSGRTSTGT